MKKLLFVPVILCLFLSFTGCKKNKQYDLTPDINVADDIVLSESAYNHATENLLLALADPALHSVFHSVIDSAFVVFDTAENEYIFNYTSKLCPDSVVRYGKIEMYVFGSLPDTGTIFKIYFQNFMEYQHLITGRDSVVYKGTDGSGKMVFRNYIIYGVIHKDLELIDWNSTNNFMVDPSLFQPGHTLDYYITGQAYGTSSKGHTFTAKINDSLIHQQTCPWILSGTIDLHIPGADVENGTIDFIVGDGCTNKLKYDFEGNIYYLWNDHTYLSN